MPMNNRMSDLLDKIERRIGTRPLHLPENLTKDKWVKVIDKDSLTTFSRFFPHKIRYLLTPDKKKTTNTYVIDEDLCSSVEILGAGDIDWHEFSAKAPAYQYGGGWGTFDLLSSSYDAEDIMMTQMIADHVSIFSNGIYVEYIPPNMVKLTGIIEHSMLNFMTVIPINLFVKHSTNLMTIEPTKMETFEDLAIADVANFLYEELKYYDGIETVFAGTDMKIGDLQNKADRRADIIQYLKESYVSPANKNQPIMYCIN